MTIIQTNSFSLSETETTRESYTVSEHRQHCTLILLIVWGAYYLQVVQVVQRDDRVQTVKPFNQLKLPESLYSNLGKVFIVVDDGLQKLTSET